MSQFLLSCGVLCLYDDEDAAIVARGPWHVGNGYVRRSSSVDGKRTLILMHREILSAPDGVRVDHANGNRADNRRSNLRLCTHAENMRNRAVSKSNGLGLKGVYCEMRRGRPMRWRAQIECNNRRFRLGLFKSPEAAYAAYCAAAKRLHGEFARLA